MGTKKLLAAASLLILSFNSHGATGTLNNVKIEKLIVSESRFGGCMAMLSSDIAAAVPSCPDKWVTFACDGSLDNSVARAMQKWDIAQLAYALDKPVLVVAESQKTINGYCFADIIRLEP